MHNVLSILGAALFMWVLRDLEAGLLTSLLIVGALVLETYGLRVKCTEYRMGIFTFLLWSCHAILSLSLLGRLQDGTPTWPMDFLMALVVARELILVFYLFTDVNSKRWTERQQRRADWALEIYFMIASVLFWEFFFTTIFNPFGKMPDWEAWLVTALGCLFFVLPMRLGLIWEDLVLIRSAKDRWLFLGSLAIFIVSSAAVAL